MIRFFISHEGTIAQLPVNPEKLGIKTPGNNRSLQVVDLGEIKVLKNPKLSVITIKSFFPMTSEGGYVLTKGKFEEPEFYLNFIDTIRRSKIPARLIVTDLDINMDISIDAFTPEYSHGTGDVQYELKLSEYRHHKAKVMRPVAVLSAAANEIVDVSVKTSNRAKNGFAIGDTIIVNGTYYISSYGDTPSNTFTQYTGKISHIVSDLSRQYRYHITTTEGGYLGWVSKSQLSLT